jgi:ESCRT-II complex subunit VPS36
MHNTYISFASDRNHMGPLSLLAPLPLTPAGLPRLDSADGEVALLSRDGVELRSSDDGGDSRVPGLSLTLTTHRIALLLPEGEGGGDGGENGGGRFVHLAAVAAAVPAGGPSLASPRSTYKLLVRTHLGGRGGSGTELVLVFRSPRPSADRDAVLEGILLALRRRAWEAAAREEERRRGTAAAGARRVGVDAILARNRRRHREAERIADGAFEGGGDVEALMEEAGELVRIIRGYVATLEKGRGKGGGDDDGEGGEDGDRLAGMLMDMGMASALSRDQAGGGRDKEGSAYHRTVARQLTDFLRHGGRLEAAGGMMALPDAYCLFNRARGTNLVSPDDLLLALHWAEKLGLGIKRREFDSGVAVVQDDAYDGAAVAGRLAEAADGSGLTVMDASRALGVGAMLANEQLLAAEGLGRLCRDVTMEGTRFFRNRFLEGGF